MIKAKLWVYGNEDGDEDDYQIHNVFVEGELNDADQIFVDINSGGEVNMLQLEMGDHSALMLAAGLIECVAASASTRASELAEALSAINSAINDDEED